MRKIWAMICTVIMLGITISVSGVQNSNAGDMDGDTNKNPWEDLLTTMPTTAVETTSKTETTTALETTSKTETTTAPETTSKTETTTAPETTSKTETTTSLETTSKTETTTAVETTSKTEPTTEEESSQREETTSQTVTEQTTTVDSNKVTQKNTKTLKPGKTKIRRAVKKKKSPKLYLKFKKVAGVKRYQIQISKTKKFKKVLVKRTVKKVKVTVINKKIKNKNKLYVRVRAIKKANGKTYQGKWTVRKIRIKKK